MRRSHEEEFKAYIGYLSCRKVSLYLPLILVCQRFYSDARSLEGVAIMKVALLRIMKYYASVVTSYLADCARPTATNLTRNFVAVDEYGRDEDRAI